MEIWPWQKSQFSRVCQAGVALGSLWRTSELLLNVASRTAPACASGRRGGRGRCGRLLPSAEKKKRRMPRKRKGRREMTGAI